MLDRASPFLVKFMVSYRGPKIKLMEVNIPSYIDSREFFTKEQYMKL
jgi:hypothetical protein